MEEIKNYGKNNYSCGMELVILKVNDLKEVINSENYFLNPSAKWDDKACGEVYAVKGTREQYEHFYKRQKDAQIAKRMLDHFGWINRDVPRDEWKAYEEKMLREYKDWWEL